MEPIISVKNLYKSFGAHTVLSDISVDIHSREVVVDRAFRFGQGIIVEEGRPEQLFGSPTQECTQLFLSKVL